MLIMQQRMIRNLAEQREIPSTAADRDDTRSLVPQS